MNKVVANGIVMALIVANDYVQAFKMYVCHGELSLIYVQAQSVLANVT